MGDVHKDSVIDIDGIVIIYIGGHFDGTIKSKGSSYIYIKGHSRGSIFTGAPSTEIVVNGDFQGSIKSTENHGSLATITVFGYTDSDKIKQIFNTPYPLLSAAFHYCNLKPGIYRFPIPNNKYYTVINQVR